MKLRVMFYKPSSLTNKAESFKLFLPSKFNLWNEENFLSFLVLTICKAGWCRNLNQKFVLSLQLNGLCDFSFQSSSKAHICAAKYMREWWWHHRERNKYQKKLMKAMPRKQREWWKDLIKKIPETKLISIYFFFIPSQMPQLSEISNFVLHFCIPLFAYHRRRLSLSLAASWA